MAQFRSSALEPCPAVWELRPERFADPRGSFAEVYHREAFRKHGIDFDFVQDNQSLSRLAGTIRGLHFQRPPFAQTKLVRVLRGAIFDVAVDLRHGSPTFGRHVRLEVSAEAFNQVLIPRGFAHGFCTLEADTEVLYKTDQYYSPEHEWGVLWSDPDLAIPWPVDSAKATVSEKDKALPRLRDLPVCFGDAPGLVVRA
jgi:dTDP-4-dehydrorhamnose 3,5-epimerase